MGYSSRSGGAYYCFIVGNMIRFNYSIDIGQRFTFRFPFPNMMHIDPSMWMRFKFWLLGTPFVSVDFAPGKRDAVCYGRYLGNKVYFYKVETT